MNTTHDFKGLTDWVEIFRAGQQTDSQGRVHNFTVADLDSVVANHDPAHPAPHVITHRQMYSPFRYGDATELKRDGEALFARSSNIEPQFEALVKNGRLPDRSIRIKPTVNGFKLAHIAWLGAEPPAVEGMAPVQFNAPSENEFDFMSDDSRADSYTPSLLGRVLRRMRDVWIDKFSLEEADKVLPEYEIESLNDHAKSLREPSSAVSSFSKSKSGDPRTSIDVGEGGAFASNNNKSGDVTMSEFSKEQLDKAVEDAVAAERAQAETDFASMQDETNKALAGERRQRREIEFKTVIDSLQNAGKLTPAQSVGMSDFMLQLADGDDAQFEFSAGEGNKAETVKKTPVEWFKEFVASLGKQVDMGESNAGDDSSASAAEFNAPAGSHVDADKLAIHNKALEYQAQHPGIDYVAAVQAVEQQEK